MTGEQDGTGPAGVELTGTEHVALHPRVALRPEPFGAMAYHYGNRRLVFLRSRRLVRLVEELGDHACVDDALAAAGVGERQRPSYLRALSSLRASDFLTGEPPTGPDAPAAAGPAPEPAGP